MKKTTKKRYSPTTSAPMAPGRVLAPTPESTKRMLEPDEAPTTRVTRQKSTVIAQSNHRESQLERDETSSVQRNEGFQYMDEETTVIMDPSHHTTTREQQLLNQDEGKSIFLSSLLQLHFLMSASA